jgi:putative FmdB family regulatory protein
MPIYEYECAKCGHVHEIFQKISDKPLTKCPVCAGRLSKLISQSSFHLKGSGWYVTDYAKRSGGASASPTTKASEEKKTDTPTSSAVKADKKASE